LNVTRSGSSLCAAALLLMAAGPRTFTPSARAADATAVIVLIGDADHTPELVAVLAESLLQQGVQAQFNKKPRFEPSALLDAGKDDTRVWVFVALAGPLRARLYFRGPRGERFLLRELALRAGLDEVGRELIGRVVETSALALLHSSEGLNRAQAEQGIAAREHVLQLGANASRVDAAHEREEESAREEEERARTADSERGVDRARERFDEPGPSGDGDNARGAAERWLLGARVLGQWTGSALQGRYGAGFELGHVLSRAAWPHVRLRAAFELNLAQTLERSAVDARVSTWPLRIGIDLGITRGVHAWLLGLGTGFDRVRTTAEHARDAGLMLSEPTTQLLPVSRAELRYELGVSPVLLSVAALIDVPWAVTHYDVLEQGQRVRLGTPWQLRPGFVLGFGARL
jgi:hypothetical protein